MNTWLNKIKKNISPKEEIQSEIYLIGDRIDAKRKTRSTESKI